MDRNAAIGLIGAFLVIVAVVVARNVGAPATSLGYLWAAIAVLSILLGTALLLYVALSLAEEANRLWLFASLYRNVRSFFSSGVFYIILGAAFLVAAYSALGQVHSAFIFLLAILGVAIVLFGTGTQAAGTGNTGTLNVAIAGGAGVLAAVFGFGVIKYAGEIQKVFKGTVDYGVVDISNSDIQSLDFQKDYDVTAELYDGSRLHLWRRQKEIQILLPIRNVSERDIIVLHLNPKAQYEDRDDKDVKSIQINWAGSAPQPGDGNEQRRVFSQTLPLKLLPSVRTDGGAAITISPQ